jgi:hypothetical protein
MQSAAAQADAANSCWIETATKDHAAFLQARARREQLLESSSKAAAVLTKLGIAPDIALEFDTGERRHYGLRGRKTEIITSEIAGWSLERYSHVRHERGLGLDSYSSAYPYRAGVLGLDGALIIASPYRQEPNSLHELSRDYKTATYAGRVTRLACRISYVTPVPTRFADVEAIYEQVGKGYLADHIDGMTQRALSAEDAAFGMRLGQILVGHNITAGDIELLTQD